VPEARESSKSLKYITIIAIALFAAIAVFVIVVEIARRDAEDETGNFNLRLASVEFDSDSIVMLEFRPIPDPQPITQSVSWSLGHWRVTSIVIHPDAFDLSRTSHPPVKLMEELKRLRDPENMESE
jgi:hypothetical protein